MAVTALQATARARVAVTRTGETASGARGHARAMEASEGAHSILKDYEKLARNLNDVKERLPLPEQAEAKQLVAYLASLYSTSDDHGQVSIREPSGREAAGLANRKARAERLFHQGRSR